MYYVYMLRCKDNSIYTGITNDIEERMKVHFEKKKKCARYTYVHDALRLESVWVTESKSLAAKLEYHIKKLTKLQKEQLISRNEYLNIFLADKINVEKYKYVKELKG